MIQRKTSTFGITLKNTPDGVVILPSSRIHQPITQRQASTGGHRNSPNRKCPRAETTGPAMSTTSWKFVRSLLKEATDFFGKQQKRRVSQNRKATSFTALFLLVFVRLLFLDKRERSEVDHVLICVWSSNRLNLKNLVAPSYFLQIWLQQYHGSTSSTANSNCDRFQFLNP